MAVLKLTRSGSSAAILVPDEMLDRLNAQPGDSVEAVETAEGAIILLPRDVPRNEVSEKARDIMRRYKETLAILAK